MKPSFLLGVALGYVLGTRAGRERYEDIVAAARRVAGSQTVQATAGVIQAQVLEITEQAKQRVGRGSIVPISSLNGHSGNR